MQNFKLEIATRSRPAQEYPANTQPFPVWTFGYKSATQGIRKPADLLATARRLGARVIDIRFDPMSPIPQWRRPALMAQFNDASGTFYNWLPELGNVNFDKPGEPIRISNAERGLYLLENWLLAQPLILMCACSDVHYCHRKTVAMMLFNKMKRGFRLSELKDLDIAPELPGEGFIGAITVHQPHAQLLALGEKIYETRGWPEGYTGPILIHASQNTENLSLFYSEPFRSVFARHGIHDASQLATGAFVGVGEMVGCYKSEEIYPHIEGSEEEAFGDFSMGRFGFHCKNMQTLNPPVPWRGQPKLWRVSEPDFRAAQDAAAMAKHGPTSEQAPLFSDTAPAPPAPKPKRTRKPK